MTILISIVVPTYQRPQLLDRCLRALVTQQFDPRRYEIIVANDRPTKEVEKVVRSWQEATQDMPRIRYLPVRGSRGPAAARNRGWHITAGRIIAFTDDDTIPLPDWLSEGWKAMQQGTIAAWGYVRVPLPENPTDYELDASRLDGASFVTANCFVHKAALLQLGGFDERFTLAWREDSDLFFSLKRIGKVVYAPNATVIHPIRPAPWGVSILQQSKVLFDVLLFKKHPRLYRREIRSNPPWNYYLIVSALLGVVISGMAQQTSLAGVFLLIWLALTAQFCWLRLKQTSHSFSHVSEMIVTSMFIPPLAVFWRLVGALKFRVFFI